jgi:hypothetical protein
MARLCTAHYEIGGSNKDRFNIASAIESTNYPAAHFNSVRASPRPVVMRCDDIYPEFVLSLSLSLSLSFSGSRARRACEKYRFAAVFHSDCNSATRASEGGRCPIGGRGGRERIEAVGSEDSTISRKATRANPFIKTKP